MCAPETVIRDIWCIYSAALRYNVETVSLNYQFSSYDGVRHDSSQRHGSDMVYTMTLFQHDVQSNMVMD